MASLQTEVDCQNDDPNYQFPMEIESSLRFPLDSSMRIIFTGYYNGFGVEVRGVEEMSMLYHMGCFGKGTMSRSKPKAMRHDDSPAIMRTRQFQLRNYWFKKFDSPQENSEHDEFFKNAEMLRKKIIKDSASPDVIDLVSSNDDLSDDNSSDLPQQGYYLSDKRDIVVVVPNSDSEDDDYFLKLRPKCCINKTKLEEKLMLTKQEAFFLVFGLGCLQIINSENKLLSIKACWELFVKDDRYFISKYVVYHYYRSKGYIVKPGIKFGGDYLLYREGPGINHSDYIVVVKHRHEEYNDWLTILGHVRVAATTVKEILIVEVIQPNKTDLQLPVDLKDYTVKEIVLTRNIPLVINTDAD